ncbi:MAG: response regulator [Actinomycetales bacterium]
MAVSQEIARPQTDVDDHDHPAPAKRLSVMVYSDDRQVRADLIRALGPRPTPDLPEVDYVECATAAAAIALVDRGGFDLLILDGEAAPTGGAGLARQLKDEIFDCPPVLILIARPQDAWLATWSRAEAVALHPINALTLPGQVADLLRVPTPNA